MALPDKNTQLSAAEFFKKHAVQDQIERHVEQVQQEEQKTQEEEMARKVQQVHETKEREQQEQKKREKETFRRRALIVLSLGVVGAAVASAVYLHHSRKKASS